MSEQSWKPPKAIGTVVVVVPDEVDTDEEGNQVDECGLYYGREVHLPSGRVVSIGPDAAKALTLADANGVRSLEIGDRLIFQRDLAGQMEYDGVKVNFVRAVNHCKACGQAYSSDSIVGVQDD
tara:strand:- start:54 stop:422 length:369 start_codon:yes stop_codon:yes gene_type:complete